MRIHVPNTSEQDQFQGVAQVPEGGTSADNAPTAAANLEGVRVDELDQSIAQLSEGNTLKPENIPEMTDYIPMLKGDFIGNIGDTLIFEITNYDFEVDYQLSATEGDVVLVGETIEYTLPMIGGSSGFWVRDRFFEVTVNTPHVQKPTIIQPEDLDTDLPENLVITGSAFTPVYQSDTHWGTQFEISGNPDFQGPDIQVVWVGTGDLTTYTFEDLEFEKTYYIRIFYVGTTLGPSEYSDTISVTIKARDPWVEVNKNLPEDTAAWDNFGYSVSMSSDGSRVIVGAYQKDSGAGGFQGAAYIFIRDGTSWVQEQKLLASDAANSDRFGWSVSISGDGTRVIIGAQGKNSGAGNPFVGFEQGAAYIFVRSGSTWTQETKLLSSDTTGGDQFGESVSISGDGGWVIIGAPYKNSGAGNSQGATYIFIRDGTTWTQETKLLASDTSANDRFGYSVSMSSDGSRVIVGAYQKNSGAGSFQGAAYIFSRSGSTWTEEQKLLALDAAANDQFGYSVSISGDGTRVVVGATRKDSGAGNGQGAAYIFSRSESTWTQEAKLLASDTAASDYFGHSVSISGDGSRVIVGADRKNSGFSQQGAAYIFSRSGSTWVEEQKLLASDAASNDYFGQSVSISGDGTRVISGAYYKSSGISLQGAVYTFDFNLPYIVRPLVTSPPYGEIDVDSEEPVVVQLTPFVVTNDGSDTHLKTEYEVSKNPQFTDIIYSGELTAGDLTTFTIPSEDLDYQTNYYIRAQYYGTEMGSSDWGGVSKFLTIDPPIWLEDGKLLSTDPDPGDFFGHSLSISDDQSRVVIGAYGKNSGGGAYVFVRSGATWTQEVKLLASDPAAGDRFGQSVSISGDGSRVIVGAHIKNSGAGIQQGAAYIFSRSGSTWTEEQKLLPLDTATGDNFGHSVSISGDGARVIIGAWAKNSGFSVQGAAYVFVRSGTTWTQEQKLLASDAAASDRLGWSVSISGDGSRVVIGAPYKNSGFSNQGAAYIFVRSETTWTEEQKLLISDAAANDQFGTSVAITNDGTRAIIGTLQQNSGAGDYQGAAYIFVRSGISWIEEQKLLPLDTAAEDRFGWSVSISGDGAQVIIGAWAKNSGFANQGAAYVFVRSGTTWAQEQKLLPSDTEGSIRFGYSVSIFNDGTQAIIGAPYKNSGAGSNQGAFYSFHFTPPYVEQPVVLSPTHGEGDIPYEEDLVVQLSPFTLMNGGTAIHTSTIYEVARDSSFDDIILSGVVEAGDLEEFTIPAIELEWTSSYYIRVKYTSDSLPDSVWSRISEFKTLDKDPYIQTWKFLPNDTAAGDFFGSSLAVFNDGQRVLIGASLKNSGAGNNQGAAYVFVRNGTTWVQESKLLPSDTAAGDQFGSSVAVSGDNSRAIIGAPNKNSGDGPVQGAAYIFVRSGSTWTQEQKLLASDTASIDEFSNSVSISDDGTRVVVGSVRKSSGAGTYQGAAYIFVRSGTTWTQEQKLLPSDTAAEDRFGISVSISSDGSLVAVGASYKNSGLGTSQGGVYIFTRSGTTWTQGQKLLPSDTTADDSFGMSVSISHDLVRVIIGASTKNSGAGANQGAVYIFIREGASWTEEQKLLASDAAAGDRFGQSVSISGDGSRAIIGAYNKHSGLAGQGAAYIFSRDGSIWTQERKLLAPDPAANARFAQSVSITRDSSLIVTCARWKDSGAGANQGAVYTFEYDLMEHPLRYNRRIIVSNSEYDYNGTSLAVSDDKNIIVMAGDEYDQATPPLLNSGRVSIFARFIDKGMMSYVPNTNLVEPVSTASSRYGSSIALSSQASILAIGAFGSVASGVMTGAVYIYERNGYNWPLMETIFPVGASGNSGFGASSLLSKDGTELYVGAPTLAKPIDGIANRPGGVYIYRRSPGQLFNDGDIELLSAGDLINGDGFGARLALDASETTLVISASGHNHNGTSGEKSGVAYVYTRESKAHPWSTAIETILVNPEVAANDRFSSGIAINTKGDTIVLGAASNYPSDGFGYITIYKKINDLWQIHTSVNRYLPLSVAAYEGFGINLAVSPSGREIVVSSVAKNGNAGMAYIFHYDHLADRWIERANRVTPYPKGYGMYGAVVQYSDDGEEVYIGAPREKVGTVDRRGAVYVYKKTHDKLFNEIRIKDPNVETGGCFGLSMAFSGDKTRLVIGKTRQDLPSGTRSGTAYIYRKDPSLNQWMLETILQASDAYDGDNFGWCTAINNDGTRVAIGAPNYTGPGNGAVYTFTRSGATWTQEQKLTAPSGSQLGSHLKINPAGTMMVLGAPGSNKAYVSHLVGGVWTARGEVIGIDPGGTHGISVDMTDDGNRIIVGDPTGKRVVLYDWDEGLGGYSQTHIFTASSSVHFGYSVAMNGDGTIGAVGDYGYNGSSGAFYTLDLVNNTMSPPNTEGNLPGSGLGAYISMTKGLSIPRMLVDRYNLNIFSIPGHGLVYAYEITDPNEISAYHDYIIPGDTESSSTQAYFGRYHAITRDGSAYAISSFGYNNREGVVFIYE